MSLCHVIASVIRTSVCRMSIRPSSVRQMKYVVPLCTDNYNYILLTMGRACPSECELCWTIIMLVNQAVIFRLIYIQ